MLSLHLKLLGALAMLVCALSVLASTASALEYESEANKYTDKEASFVVSSGKTGVKLAQIKCTEASFATPAAKGTTLKVTPSFGMCNSVLSGKAVETKVANECKEAFQLNQPEEATGDTPGVYTSTVTLLKGCKLAFTLGVSECVIKIEGPQENLKSAYYNSLAQVKLAGSQTVFEVANTTDTATKGCIGTGLDESGDKIQLQFPPRPLVEQHQFERPDGMYGVNGYTPIFKNIEPGTMAALTQEFKWPTPGKGAIRCSGAEYTNAFAMTSAAPALLLKPVLSGCKIQEEAGGAESAVATVTIPAACRFRLAAIQGVGNTLASELQTLNCEIKFEVPGGGGCEVKLEPTGPRSTVAYIKRVLTGSGEMEAAFNVTNLNGIKVANCPNMAGSVVTYSGAMFVGLNIL